MRKRPSAPLLDQPQIASLKHRIHGAVHAERIGKRRRLELRTAFSQDLPKECSYKEATPSPPCRLHERRRSPSSLVSLPWASRSRALQPCDTPSTRTGPASVGQENRQAASAQPHRTKASSYDPYSHRSTHIRNRSLRNRGPCRLGRRFMRLRGRRKQKRGWKTDASFPA